MSKTPNQSETERASGDASLDDRLDSLMADLERDLHHLDPQGEDQPSAIEAAERTSNDIESSAAQLMRDLNDALNGVEQEAEPEAAAPQADATPDEKLDASDLRALDEALASGAQPATVDEQRDVALPSDPEELAAALDENDVAEVLPETEPEAGHIEEQQAEADPEPKADVKVAPSPPRSRPDEPEAAASAAPPEAPEAPIPPESALSVETPTAAPARLQAVALKVAHILALPLAVFPPSVRDYIGWFGIVTLINAGALWTFWLLFRA